MISRKNPRRLPSKNSCWRRIALLVYLAIVFALFFAMGFVDIIVDACWNLFAVY